MGRRLPPVFCLLLLAPLIAEFLLGSMAVGQLSALPVMVGLYGGGAVLVRELALRAGRGWRSLVLLAAAYGVIEEGCLTQSLFNPNYFHLRLLDFGFVPVLGTSPVWALYVLTIHVAWSIAVPIGLTEALFPAARPIRWLGPIGLTVIALLYLLGAVAVAFFTYRTGPFIAPAPRLAGAGMAALLLAAAAWWGARSRASAAVGPSAPVLFVLGFGTGSAFCAIEIFAAAWLAWGPGVVFALLLACILLVLGVTVRTQRRGTWSAAQCAALALGGFAVYVWVGFHTDLTLHGAGDLPGHAVLAAALVALAMAAGYRAARAKPDAPAADR